MTRRSYRGQSRRQPVAAPRRRRRDRPAAGRSWCDRSRAGSRARPSPRAAAAPAGRPRLRPTATSANDDQAGHEHGRDLAARRAWPCRLGSPRPKRDAALGARPDPGQVAAMADEEQDQDGDREKTHGNMLTIQGRRFTQEVRRHEGHPCQKCRQRNVAGHAQENAANASAAIHTRSGRAPALRPGWSRPPCRLETSR